MLGVVKRYDREHTSNDYLHVYVNRNGNDMANGRCYVSVLYGDRYFSFMSHRAGVEKNV